MRLEGKSLKSDFLRFIIPSIIAQWVFSLYTMVDGIFVARGVSEVALTAVNISMPLHLIGSDHNSCNSVSRAVCQISGSN